MLVHVCLVVIFHYRFLGWIFSWFFITKYVLGAQRSMGS